MKAERMQPWVGRIAFVVVTTAALWLIGDAASLSQIPKPTFAQENESSITRSGDLQIASTTLPGGTQQIVLLESGGRTMAVYHIDPAQGKIQLKSVRNLTWDLRMEQFNGQQPLPSELRQVEP